MEHRLIPVALLTAGESRAPRALRMLRGDFQGEFSLSAARLYCHPGKTSPLFADHHSLEARSSLGHSNKRHGRWRQNTSVRPWACGQSGDWRAGASAASTSVSVNLTTRLGSGPSFSCLPHYKVTERLATKSRFLNCH